MQDHQRVKWFIIGLFWFFGYNYRMNDKVARIGKYGFTRAFYCGKAEKGWIFERVRCACSTDNFGDLFVCYGQYLSLCDGHIWWCDCIRYLVCCHHFWCVFRCYFGMSHHFMGKNWVIFGMVHHFRIFRVYSTAGHNRTIFCLWCKDKCFCVKDIGYQTGYITTGQL